MVHPVLRIGLVGGFGLLVATFVGCGVRYHFGSLGLIVIRWFAILLLFGEISHAFAIAKPFRVFAKLARFAAGVNGVERPAEYAHAPPGHFFGLDGMARWGGVDVTFHGHGCLRLIAQGLVGKDILDVITPPSLHHEQQVKACPMGAVVCFEIVVGVGYEAFQVARQKQVGQNVARVVGGGIVAVVSDGQAHGLDVGGSL